MLCMMADDESKNSRFARVRDLLSRKTKINFHWPSHPVDPPARERLQIFHLPHIRFGTNGGLDLSQDICPGHAKTALKCPKTKTGQSAYSLSIKGLHVSSQLRFLL